MKECPSFPGYQVSADGCVISTRRRKAPVLLKTFRTKKGYLTVAAVTSSGIRPIGVHQLVADAYHGPRPTPTSQVRHLDGNPENNCASNLAWGEAVDNATDRKRHGRYSSGARHVNAKLSEESARTIVELRRCGTRIKQLSDRFNVSVSTIEGIIYGKTWRHLCPAKS